MRAEPHEDEVVQWNAVKTPTRVARISPYTELDRKKVPRISHEREEDGDARGDRQTSPAPAARPRYPVRDRQNDCREHQVVGRIGVHRSVPE